MSSTAFQPVKTRPWLDGEQRLYRFDNGFGASVVSSGMSYGGSAGLWEMAVIVWDGEDFELTYDTPVTSDVIGHLSEVEVDEKLTEIKALEPSS